MASPVKVAGGMPTVTVSQSTMVALALFVLFLVYITAKGELQNYLAVVFGSVSTTASGTGSTGTTTGTTTTSSVQSALSTTQGALGLVQQTTNLLNGGGGGGNLVGSPGSTTTFGPAAGDVTVSGGGDFGATGAISGNVDASGTGGLF